MKRASDWLDDCCYSHTVSIKPTPDLKEPLQSEFIVMPNSKSSISKKTFQKLVKEFIVIPGIAAAKHTHYLGNSGHFDRYDETVAAQTPPASPKCKGRNKVDEFDGYFKVTSLHELLNSLQGNSNSCPATRLYFNQNTEITSVPRKHTKYSPFASSIDKSPAIRTYPNDIAVGLADAFHIQDPTTCSLAAILRRSGRYRTPRRSKKNTIITSTALINENKSLSNDFYEDLLLVVIKPVSECLTIKDLKRKLSYPRYKGGKNTYFVIPGIFDTFIYLNPQFYLQELANGSIPNNVQVMVHNHKKFFSMVDHISNPVERQISGQLPSKRRLTSSYTSPCPELNSPKLSPDRNISLSPKTPADEERLHHHLIHSDSSTETLSDSSTLLSSDISPANRSTLPPQMQLMSSPLPSHLSTSQQSQQFNEPSFPYRDERTYSECLSPSFQSSISRYLSNEIDTRKLHLLADVCVESLTCTQRSIVPRVQF